MLLLCIGGVEWVTTICCEAGMFVIVARPFLAQTVATHFYISRNQDFKHGWCVSKMLMSALLLVLDPLARHLASLSLAAYRTKLMFLVPPLWFSSLSCGAVVILLWHVVMLWHIICCNKSHALLLVCCCRCFRIVL